MWQLGWILTFHCSIPGSRGWAGHAESLERKTKGGGLAQQPHALGRELEHPGHPSGAIRAHPDRLLPYNPHIP